MGLLRSVLVALMSLLLVGAAAAQGKCDLSDRTAMVSLEPVEFFARPAGSLAIGEGCDPKANSCAKYFDITGCQEVDYAISESGSPGRLNLSVNPLVHCEGGCELLDSFLMVALTFPHQAGDSEPRVVSLTRNASKRWNPLGGGTLSQQTCCEGATIAETFTAIHKGDDPKELRRRTKMTWHSSMTPPKSKAIETFGHRQFFVDVLETCDCSMKAFLLRFLETEGSKDQSKPETPLFFSAILQAFDQVNIDIDAPLDAFDVYHHDLVVRILR